MKLVKMDVLTSENRGNNISSFFRADHTSENRGNNISSTFRANYTSENRGNNISSISRADHTVAESLVSTPITHALWKVLLFCSQNLVFKT